MNVTGVDLGHLTKMCNGYSFEDLNTLVNVAAAKDITKGCYQIQKNHLEAGFEFMQKLMDDAIGAPKIPTVKWYDTYDITSFGNFKNIFLTLLVCFYREDVGGLGNAKSEILDVVQSSQRTNKKGYRRSGILM